MDDLTNSVSTHPLAGGAALARAGSVLLAAGGLELTALERVLGERFSGMDYADLYFESTQAESWSLEEGLVKDGSFDIAQGVGVRAISGEQTGFAYSDDITLAAIESAAQAASGIILHGARTPLALNVSPRTPASGSDLYAADNPLASLDSAAKVALLKELDAYTRTLDTRIIQVMVSLIARHTHMLVIGSDGALAADVRPLARLNISVVVEENGRRETASFGGGARCGYDFFTGERTRAYAQEAVRQALVALQAQAAPAGEMTVVLGAGWPGILLHEAVGHGLEGDFNRKGTSAFTDRIGQRVAAAGVTVVDDGTLAGRRGSLNVDDEGAPTQCTTLIADGILRAYIQDKHNAALMRAPQTGNGRRESYAHLPMPRMTNTYMLNGAHTHDEIIASVKNGLYCANFGGGQVDITNGKFVFSASEAYKIEHGKITRPVKGATLVGNGPDVLTRVSMIGNNMQLDNGVGTCGKNGQSVPVGVGQPTLRIDGLTVGGTQI